MMDRSFAPFLSQADLSSTSKRSSTAVRTKDRPWIHFSQAA